MEGSNTLSSSGVTVVGSDAPSNYHVAPRPISENPTGSAPPASVVSPPAADGVATALKKKRGRPRKYGPDGPVSMALSPKPISSSAPPPVIDFSAVGKRGKVTKLHLPRGGTESLSKRIVCLMHACFIQPYVCVLRSCN